ncbi:hypothetical protein GCM10010191_07320 [Actinomadura vinacea]|uniref:Trans-2-decenoyl-[acyl-carrier-protein] isomerase n=1 Tax=Actinomadura vinacea TaxID=115336 RepID=A0ABP5VIJ6_9ACTN
MTTTADDDLLAFEGEAFHFDVGAFDVEPQPARPARPGPSGVRGPDAVARVAGRLRDRVATAHASALAAQEALQRLRVAALTTAPMPEVPAADLARPRAVAPVLGTFVVTMERTGGDGLAIVATPIEARPRELPRPATTEGAFKPLARTGAERLGPDDLDRLRSGDVAGVFGAAYDQDGCNPGIRLFTTGHGMLVEVGETTRRAGRWHHGRMRAACALPGAASDAVRAVAEAAAQAAQVFALNLGLHLCLAGTAFAPRGCEVELVGPIEPGEHELELEISDVDLIPRPWLTAEAELRAGGATVARVHGLRLEIREGEGVPVGPGEGGVVPGFLGRKNAAGERALLGEFHMIHSSRGDLAVTLGPEFARTAGRRATRMPAGGLRLCDRLMRVEGTRHRLDHARGESEYDSPADSWYYLETANSSMPNVIYMETSLQSALLLGYYLGATLTDPEEDYSLRNLDGTATVLREVDLRDKTIRQRSELLGTSVLSGAVLQNFAYELSVDGEPFYKGESLFGFFSEQALANQTGLDGGAYVPTWLERQERPPATRTIKVGPAGSTGHLHLLDEIEVADGAGEHGRGYLRAVRPISGQDWFFRRHFHLDPVMPGSLGVEAVVQALQEWLVDSGLAAHLVDARFVLPAGLPMSWRYRGQILASDGQMTVEAHIKDVIQDDESVRVVADANVWKPHLRIYGLENVGVELRGART